MQQLGGGRAQIVRYSSGLRTDWRVVIDEELVRDQSVADRSLCLSLVGRGSPMVDAAIRLGRIASLN